MRPIVVCLFLILAFAVDAQVPNVHMNSSDGISFDLYNTLDSGKIVVLDFFAVNCGYCQEATPTLDDYWINLLKKGKLGWVWAIETSSVDNRDVNSFLKKYGGTYPGFSTQKNDSVISHEFGYGVDYTPQYYLVKPNHSAELLNLAELKDSIVSYFSDTVDIYNPDKLSFSVFYSDGQINIHLNRDINVGNIFIYNLLGDNITSYKVVRIDSNKYLAKVKSLFSGVYIVNVFSKIGLVGSKKIFITNY